MEAHILSFRNARHPHKMNHFLLEMEGVDSKEKAIKMVGKKVVWKSKGGKHIHGVIAAAHGGKGVLRARFSRGLPGEAVGTKVALKE